MTEGGYLEVMHVFEKNVGECCYVKALCQLDAAVRCGGTDTRGSNASRGPRAHTLTLAFPLGHTWSPSISSQHRPFLRVSFDPSKDICYNNTSFLPPTRDRRRPHGRAEPPHVLLGVANPTHAQHINRGVWWNCCAPSCAILVPLLSNS